MCELFQSKCKLTGMATSVIQYEAYAAVMSFGYHTVTLRSNDRARCVNAVDLAPKPLNTQWFECRAELRLLVYYFICTASFVSYKLTLKFF